MRSSGKGLLHCLTVVKTAWLVAGTELVGAAIEIAQDLKANGTRIALSGLCRSDSALLRNQYGGLTVRTAMPCRAAAIWGLQGPTSMRTWASKWMPR